jgi:hypothetical protein
MKYLITESQFDRAVFKYLDLKRFIKIKKDNDEIYFAKSKNDKYAQIWVRGDDLCFIYWKLINEISTFFNLSETDSENIIRKWVINKIKNESVWWTRKVSEFFIDWLIIPSK